MADQDTVLTIDTEQLLEQCMSILHQTGLLRTKVQQIMSIIGTYTHSKRIGVFIKDGSHKIIRKYEWINDGTFTEGSSASVFLNDTPSIPDSPKFILWENLKTQNAEEYARLEEDGVEKAYIFPLKRNGKKYGYIGFSITEQELITAAKNTISAIAYGVLAEILHLSTKSIAQNFQKRNNELSEAYNTALVRFGILAWESFNVKGKNINIIQSAPPKLLDELEIESTTELESPVDLFLKHTDNEGFEKIKRVCRDVISEKDKTSDSFVFITSRSGKKIVLSMSIFSVNAENDTKKLFFMVYNATEHFQVEKLSVAIKTKEQQIQKKQAELTTTLNRERELIVRHNAAMESAKYILLEFDLYAETIITIPTPYLEKQKKVLNFNRGGEELVSYMAKRMDLENLKKIKSMFHILRQGKEFKTNLTFNAIESMRGRTYTLRATPTMSEKGDWDSAFGTFTDITEITKQQKEYNNEFSFFNSLRLESGEMKIHVDLSKNKVLQCFPELSYDLASKSYDELIALQRNYSNYFVGEYNIAVELNKNRLFENLVRGNSCYSFMVEITHDKTLRCLKCNVNIVKNPDTDSVEMFMHTTDITKHQLETKILSRLNSSIYEFTGIINIALNSICFIGNEPYADLQYINYDSYLKREIQEKISPDYEEELKPNVTIDHIREQLDANGQYSCFFVMGKEGDYKIRHMYQYFYLDNSRGLIFLCVTDVTSQYEKEQQMLMKTQEALIAASRANLAKSEFISRISHDIRTPIGAVLNLTEFAKEDIDNREKLLNDLNKIGTSGRFLLSLINDVLDISKIDSGKIDLVNSIYAYEEYISEIRNILDPMCSEKNMNCIIENEPSQVYAMSTDKVRLNQITLNLLSNSVKYTKPGGTVVFKTKLEKEADKEKALLTIIVEDNGIGMSKEFQLHMFEEFSQEHSNPLREKATTGTGLGLSIVYKMIKLMDGNIQVESEIGKGTKFNVTIPMTIQNKDSADKLKSESAININEDIFKDKKILLAEDNEVNTEIALRMFGNFGVQLEHAEDGEIALDMFSKSKENYYSAVFMDIQMPKMNGYEATQAIRALDREDAKRIPIIAMTADAFSDAMEKAKKAGMSEYVTKPLDPNSIKRVLKILISNITNKE